MTNKLNRVVLAGTFNTRELGGYPTMDGRVTKYGVFLRSDRLDRLREADVETLKAYGMTCVIDLRSEKERTEHPDTLLMQGDFTYQSIGMMDDLMFEKACADIKSSNNSYLPMLQRKDVIRKLISTIADNKGGALFHCTGGQDRTGILACILLMMAHVSRADIVNDYLVTSTYLQRDPDLVNILPAGMTKEDVKTDPHLIEEVYDWISEAYGSVESFLLKCGVAQEKIDSVVTRFTEAAPDVRRIDLESGYNCRDIGGMPAEDKMTAFHKYVRSADVSKLSKKDLDTLYAYGIRHVIDLRSMQERELAKDVMEDDDRFTYKHYPFMCEAMKMGGGDVSKADPRQFEHFSLGDMYRELVKDGELVRGLLEYTASCEGGVLYHCSAGKDRTGVMSALLLLNAGVAECDVVSDYQKSYYYLREDPSIKEALKMYDGPLMHSDAEQIEKPLSYIRETYGSFDDYAKAIGLSDETRDKLKEGFIA